VQLGLKAVFSGKSNTNSFSWEADKTQSSKSSRTEQTLPARNFRVLTPSLLDCNDAHPILSIVQQSQQGFKTFCIEEVAQLLMSLNHYIPSC
jgi:hypothetical protein